MALFWKQKKQADEFTTAKPNLEGGSAGGGLPEHPDARNFSRPDPAAPPTPAAPAASTSAAAAPPSGGFSLRPTFPGSASGPGAGRAATSSSASAAPQPAGHAEAAPKGFFGRIKAALTDRLTQTKQEVVGQIRAAIKAASIVDENLIERIEEILITADLGPETTYRIVEAMRDFEARGAAPAELLQSFKQQLQQIIGTEKHEVKLRTPGPHVILVVGVNGVGKTTTIGKLATEFRAAGKSVLLVAGDTFRAAAVEQLEIWANRTGSEFLRQPANSDPSGLAFDAMNRAREGGIDVVLMDTAGRLHTKSNLMEELRKINRVLEKQLPGAPHDTLLVLDATTGQNAIEQARVFTQTVAVTGLVMTKLDGTAKGGVLIGIRNLFPTPVVKIGVGEAAEDLRDFDPQEFIDALFAE